MKALNWDILVVSGRPHKLIRDESLAVGWIQHNIYIMFTLGAAGIVSALYSNPIWFLPRCFHKCKDILSNPQCRCHSYKFRFAVNWPQVFAKDLLFFSFLFLARRLFSREILPEMSSVVYNSAILFSSLCSKCFILALKEW